MGEAKHIKWQDIIEVEENADHASREKVIKALAFIENSNEGQKLFAELKEAQAHIPDGQIWVKMEKVIFKNATITTTDLNGNKITKPLPDSEKEVPELDLRKEQRKDSRMVIFGVKNSGNLTGAFSIFKAFAGGYESPASYDPDFHSIPITFPNASNFKLPKIGKNGQLKYEQAPLEEIISHELQHTVDIIRKKFASGQDYSKECGEQRGVERENAFLSSAMPQVHKRHLYVDADFTLNELSKDSNFKDALKKGGGISEVFSKLVGGIKLDAGCKGISDEEATKQALALMKKYHIPTDKIDPALLGGVQVPDKLPPPAKKPSSPNSPVRP